MLNRTLFCTVICALLPVASAAGQDAQAVREGLDAIEASPLLASGARATWSGRYIGFSHFSIDPETDRPVPALTSGPFASTFEMTVLRTEGGTHVKLVPVKTHERHRSHSFGRGMDFWDRAEGSDVIAYNDQRVAHSSETFGRISAFPTDLPSPYRLLSFALSPDQDVWPQAPLDLPPEGFGGMRKSEDEQVSDADSGLAGIRQVVVLPNVLSGGEPVTVARELYFSDGEKPLPRLVRLYVGNQCATQWEIIWDKDAEAVRPRKIRATQSPLLRPDLVGSWAEYTLEMLESEAVPGAADLDVRIPEDFKVIDLDAPKTGASEAAPE